METGTKNRSKIASQEQKSTIRVIKSTIRVKPIAKKIKHVEYSHQTNTERN